MAIELVWENPGEDVGPLGMGSATAPWGRLAVAVSGGVVVAAAPGSDRDSALEGLAGAGAGTPVSGRFDRVAKRLVGAVLGAPQQVSLPVRLEGTPFRLQVWEALTGLPRGKVVTYSELAGMVGRPRAVRAVASACAANRIGVIVPCHRVVRTDGSLGGYRWGEDLKQLLIAAEKASDRARPQAEAAPVALRAA